MNMLKSLSGRLIASIVLLASPFGIINAQVFVDHVTIKAAGHANLFLGNTNSVFLDAANYPGNQSVLFFHKSGEYIASIGSDLHQNSSKDIFLATKDNHSIYINPHGGKVNIGNAWNLEQLTLDGSVHFPIGSSIGYAPSHDFFTYQTKKIGNYSLGWYVDSDVRNGPVGYYAAFGGFKFFTGASPIPKMTMSPTGTVGIGTSLIDDNYRLFVDKGIRTRKVKVDMAVWPDYVFEPAYNLNPIDSLSAYLKENKHLPGVPSAKEVAADGLDLGENQAILLKKIEELTLYLINQQKEIDDLKEMLKIKKI